MRIEVKHSESARRHAASSRRLPLQNAFTLIETLIASILIAVAGVSLFTGISLGYSILDTTRGDLRATQIAMQRLEAIRLFTWWQVQDTNYLKPTFVEYYDPLGATNNSGGAVYRGFVSRSTPTNLPAAYQTNMQCITVTLYWTNFNGRKPIVHSRQMQSYVARNGMQNYVWGGE